MSHHWLMNTSFSYNSTIVNFGGFPGSQPNAGERDDLGGSDQPRQARRIPVRLPDRRQRHRQRLRQREVAVQDQRPLSAARRRERVGVLQRAPGLSASRTRSRVPSRINGGGRSTSLLDPIGDSRLPNYQNIDFHVERPIKVGTVRFIPSLDIFNVGNFNTIQAIRSTPERGEREPDPGDPRAARHPVRRPRELVSRTGQA